jgi:hypothetical protein
MPELIEEPGPERQKEDQLFAVDFLKKTFKIFEHKIFWFLPRGY